MNKKLLTLIPLMALMVACGPNQETPADPGKENDPINPGGDKNPTNPGGEVDPSNPGGDDPSNPGGEVDPKPELKYDDYDSTIAMPENGRQVEDIDRKTTIQEAFSYCLDGFKEADSFTFENKFSINIKGLEIPEISIGEQESDSEVVQARALDEEEEEPTSDVYTILANGTLIVSLYKEVVDPEAETLEYTYGAGIYLKNFNAAISSEVKLKEEPVVINNLALRFVAQFKGEETGERIYIDLGSLPDNLEPILKLVNAFTTSEIDPSMGSSIAALIPALGYDKGYIDVKDIFELIENLNKKDEEPTREVEQEEQEEKEQSSLGLDPTSDFVSMGFEMLKLGMAFINEEDFLSGCGVAAELIKDDAEVLKYDSEIGVRVNYTEENIDALVEEIAKLIPLDSIQNIGSTLLPEEMSDIGSMDMESIKIAEGYKLYLGLGYLAGKNNGTKEAALEQASFKLNIQDGLGLSVTVENETTVKYNYIPDVFKLSDTYIELADKNDFMVIISGLISSFAQ